MHPIHVSDDEKASLVRRIQLYFSEELEQKIGSFDAEFLLEFLGREVGVDFYNRGLYDAKAVLQGRLEYLHDAIFSCNNRPMSSAEHEYTNQCIAAP